MKQLLMLILVVAATATACSEGLSPVASTAVPGSTQAIADKQPTNPNVALSCPSDAPTELTVAVDEFVAGRGWKVTIDLRRTSVNVPAYQVYYQRSGDPAVQSITLSGVRPLTTVYFPIAGVYGFRAQAWCGVAGGTLSPVVVKNVGAGGFGPDVPPPPVVPPPPPVDPSPVPRCHDTCL